MLLKTEAARYRELEKHLIENHPWQNPEVTAYRVEDGAAPYLDWISRTPNGQ